MTSFQDFHILALGYSSLVAPIMQINQKNHRHCGSFEDPHCGKPYLGCFDANKPLESSSLWLTYIIYGSFVFSFIYSENSKLTFACSFQNSFLKKSS